MKENYLSARQLAYLINEYYLIPGNEVGGNCHVVLDDNNLDDESIIFCLNLCKEKNDLKGVFIMENFLLVRKTARGKAIKLFRKSQNDGDLRWN